MPNWEKHVGAKVSHHVRQWWTWFSIDGGVQQWVKQILTPRVHAHGFVKCCFGDIWEIVVELVLSNQTKLNLTINHLNVIFEMKGNLNEFRFPLMICK
jgi:sulfur relay (sulfurtransferase) DsrC/TusE family protein